MGLSKTEPTINVNANMVGLLWICELHIRDGDDDVTT